MIATLRVGVLLGLRQIQRANFWTTLLIVLIMTFTFLNLVAVAGILVGLIEGSVKANREQYSGNIFITTPSGEKYIEKSQDVITIIEGFPEVVSYTPRYLVSGNVEANYTTRRDPFAVRDMIGTSIAGIDPVLEEATTGLSRYVVEGEYLTGSDEGEILIGANWLERYAADFGEGFATLQDVYPGSRVRLMFDDVTYEVTVKGIVDSKVNETSLRVFMNAEELRRIAGRVNLNVNEIAVKLKPGTDEDRFKQALIASGVDAYASIDTSEEAIPDFLEDIKVTFGILGAVIGAIGVVVSSITVLVVVAINAITRRKYIGILKGIGIKPGAIMVAYLMQAAVYVLAGSILGAILVFGLLVPYLDANPIDFPFSDGILVATPFGTLWRFLVLLFFSLIAGLIPSWLIIRQNTLDAILGR